MIKPTANPIIGFIPLWKSKSHFFYIIFTKFVVCFPKSHTIIMNFMSYHIMKIKILLISLFSFCQLLSAQEGIPLYQDYLTSSWYLIHPSMAGAASANQIRLTGRTQWLDVEDAPSLITGSFNGRISKKIGLGLLAFSDTNGNFSEGGVFGTFAYHLNLSARETELNQLSFGISLGFLQNKLDQSGFTSLIPDQAINGSVLSDGFASIDFGISYLHQDFYTHLSVKNALPHDSKIVTINNVEPQNQRKYIFTTGYTFSVGREDAGISFEPSFQYANTPEIAEQLVDVNAKIYKALASNNTLWGGVSYRRALESTEFVLDLTTNNIQSQNYQTLTGFVGFDYKQFVFAYTYTNQLDQVKISNSGFHQVTLGYNFGSDSDARSGSKRWDCNCPAANY